MCFIIICWLEHSWGAGWLKLKSQPEAFRFILTTTCALHILSKGVLQSTTLLLAFLPPSDALSRHVLHTCSYPYSCSHRLLWALLLGVSHQERSTKIFKLRMSCQGFSSFLKVQYQLSSFSFCCLQLLKGQSNWIIPPSQNDPVLSHHTHSLLWR